MPRTLRFKSLVVLITLCFLSQNVIAEEDSESVRTLISKVRPSVMTIRVKGRDRNQSSIGTGFLIRKDLVATNYHVINEGRAFTVETSGGQPLKVLGVEASDVGNDLALIRIQSDESLTPLELAPSGESEQGMRVLAFGNPHGLENSVVEGIVSAVREVQGSEMIQLAMPIDPGNSGGPLIDLRGRVHGVVNMKSAVDENLGFAILIKHLHALRENPNPVSIDRWVRLGTINEARWEPIFGGDWRQRGGVISANEQGTSFGGRSLLLSRDEAPERPFEVAVMVRLDSESGAAGLAFHSDGDDKHYGFYPSAGRLRLTCFEGPSVYSWDILEEVDTEHYVPGEWNHLKVRVDDDSIRCFVNGQLVIESDDQSLTTGRIGLAKFRGTTPKFKRFEFGPELSEPAFSDAATAWFAQLPTPALDLGEVDVDQINELGKSADLSSRELIRRAIALESQAKQLRRLSSDVRIAQSIAQLAALDTLEPEVQLLEGALLIATLDNPDIDISAYRDRIDQMAAEIVERIDQDATPEQRRDTLHQYLFAENGFHGSRSEYYHPANSHLNRVIDDREGLPITLAILYIELAQRVGIEMEGVGLPGHFVVRQVLGDDSQHVDVFERGALLDDADVERLVLMHTGRGVRDSDLRANTTQEILTRVLNNLIGVAGRNEDAESMVRYCDAIVAINPDKPEFRLMRAQLRGLTGRKRGALSDLNWLIEQGGEINLNAIERLRAAIEGAR